jgi:ribonuclease HI
MRVFLIAIQLELPSTSNYSLCAIIDPSANREAGRVINDPSALKLYTDGSALKNPGGPGGLACVAEYPDDWNRAHEIVFEDGYFETNNNRMELLACILALEYVLGLNRTKVNRVLIVTDSLYIQDHQNMAPYWRHDGWKNRYGRPIENSDLWKRFLSLRSRRMIRTEITWRKGKKTPILKLVDQAAKNASKNPTKADRGFRGGKVARSKVKDGSASLYPARGQEEIIRIYRSKLIRKTEHQIYFDIFDPRDGIFTEKRMAYVLPNLIGDLHRQNCYRVKFGTEPQYPIVTAILENIDCKELETGD